jgi:hypothetical protein
MFTIAFCRHFSTAGTNSATHLIGDTNHFENPDNVYCKIFLFGHHVPAMALTDGLYNADSE